ncbi:MAG: UDP-2,4-diacetamido-2,4,6-trideoxy-beta-L-altropyranose hydrolase [Nostoc sp. DedQUE12b]|uniref:UDP-2,4-diacetamido-2,4, 6-trideoxy-beta-L-altropyranose hydrolase n=1 Tax=Nostoc sp. DedQUE12b TaxID=3075398 RepID=UPI002AD1F0BC|nr:UDP-2,4-diacetamido-2,4,6-trideoxy-beta-L-altropyranose hydrolase [Nostoc sp. DedQUE12b]MDZ8085258.1 UDP-2,4-diacetamido-2,4,6-trideoxy-beta-L-altropyranose hydrolase [Nostoc sp. DedQUE12b]
MNLVFCVDACTQIGTGHLMRCLALAQAWQNTEKQAIFLMSNSVPALEQRLLSEGIKVVHLSVSWGSIEDARETASFARQLDANWLVADGYHFGAEYQRVIKDAGLSLLFIDDYAHADHYYADVVLNQNIYAHEGLYTSREPYTQLLLGVKYALLRREFWQWRGWKRETPTIARKILVTLGGSDPNNVTLKVIKALQLVELDALETVVVVGGSNPHDEQLQSASLDSRFPIHLKRNVTNMPELMAWADVAIAAGGSTSWELAFMGLPSIVLVLADNQRAIAQKLNEMGVSVHLGWHEDVSAAEIASAVAHLLRAAHTRVEMTRCGQELVDGEGSKRVLKYLEAKLLKLRLACQEDCRLLWEWSNDPEVRAVSFSTKLIPWEHHVQWFQSRLHCPTSIIYIGLDRNDVPIGQFRYELEGDKAIISISIDKKFRYQGYSIHLINLGCKKIFLNSNITIINAYAKPNNEISIKAFLKAGFKNMGKTKLGEHEVVYLIRYK